MTEINWKALEAPFKPEQLKWRAGSVSKPAPTKSRKATLLAYLTARSVMNRLDEVVGRENWQTKIVAIPGGGAICSLGIRVNGEWVWKSDGSSDSNIEGTKGGVSGALKRAAVSWGVGRYLYDLDSKWHVIQDGYANGRGADIQVAKEGHVGWVPTPSLPAWAKPQSRSATTQHRPAPAAVPSADTLDGETLEAVKCQLNRLEVPPDAWAKTVTSILIPLNITPPRNGVVSGLSESEAQKLLAYLKKQAPNERALPPGMDDEGVPHAA